MNSKKKSKAWKRRKRRRRKKKIEKLKEEYKVEIQENRNRIVVHFMKYPANMVSVMDTIIEKLCFRGKLIRFIYKNESDKIYSFSIDDMGPLTHPFVSIEISHTIFKKLNKCLSKRSQIEKCRSDKCDKLIYAWRIYCDFCQECRMIKAIFEQN
jgi:hypothetical protein